MYDHTLSVLANHKIRHQAANKIDYQLITVGHFNLCPGVCVGMHGLTYSFYHQHEIKDA